MAGCDGQIICDAQYVLAEIARGEVFSAAVPHEAQTAIAALSAALLQYRQQMDSYSQSAVPQIPVATLENALSAVMAIITPINVQTLRDTDSGKHDDRPKSPNGPTFMQKVEMLFGWGRDAYAYRFSTRFFWITIVIVVAALVFNYWDMGHTIYFLPYLRWPMNLHEFGAIAVPFSYGAMGACVFLLRTLHKHIYARTFDRRRTPEYYNRILLGAISGGTTVMLLSSKAAGPAIQAGASAAHAAIADIQYNALGFLAGYNTDLLFTAIERITNAILPKVPVTPTPQAPAPTVTPTGPAVTPPPTPKVPDGEQPLGQG